MNKRPTREELEILTASYNVAEIATQYSVSVQAVYKWYKFYDMEYRKVERQDIKLPKKYQYDDDYFSCIDTEHKAYWLGFIMADGSIIQKSKNKPSLSLVINLQQQDDMHLQKFIDDIHGNIPIRYFNSREMDITDCNGTHHLQSTPQCKVEVNSKWLCYDLMRHGVDQRKSLNERVPILDDESLCRHFIRGFFDGDGCFSAVKPSNRNREYPKIFITSGEIIIDYIMNRVYTDTKVIMGHDKYRSLYRCYIQNERDFLLFVSYIYDNATVFLDRKHELIGSYMRRYSLNV